MNKNTFKTFVLLAGLGGAAVAIGGLFGTGGAVIGFAIGLVMVGGSYWFSDKLALKAAGAKIVEEHEAPELYGMVRSLADRAGMPMPRVALSPAMQRRAIRRSSPSTIGIRRPRAASSPFRQSCWSPVTSGGSSVMPAILRL